MKGRYAETNFIEEAEAAASLLKEHGFWSLLRLLPFAERELVRAEENPPRPESRCVCVLSREMAIAEVVGIT